MKRRIIAVLWIAGGALPVLLTTVFLVGCCVLPFHGVMHKLMPLCSMATSMLRDETRSAGHAHEAVPPAPMRERQEPARSLATVVPAAFRLSALPAASRLIAPGAVTGFRSFITLGATRCDRDVGWHALVQTYLI